MTLWLNIIYYVVKHNWLYEYLENAGSSRVAAEFWGFAAWFLFLKHVHKQCQFGVISQKIMEKKDSSAEC